MDIPLSEAAISKEKGAQSMRAPNLFILVDGEKIQCRKIEPSLAAIIRQQQANLPSEEKLCLDIEMVHPMIRHLVQFGQSPV